MYILYISDDEQIMRKNQIYCLNSQVFQRMLVIIIYKTQIVSREGQDPGKFMGSHLIVVITGKLRVPGNSRDMTITCVSPPLYRDSPGSTYTFPGNVQGVPKWLTPF